jgi:hypothetical protein
MTANDEIMWDLLRDQLNRIEKKLDNKVDYRTFNEWKEEVSDRVDKLDEELEAIRQAAISPEQVTRMVGEGLKDSQARGLTAWDRRVRYGLAMLSLGTFLLLLFDRYG